MEVFIMSVKVTGIHHIALKARGLEEFRKTVAFYQDLLGLPVARAWGEGENSAVMLDTGAGLIEIFANGTDAPGQGAVRHVALQVETPVKLDGEAKKLLEELKEKLTEKNFPQAEEFKRTAGPFLGKM
jgi:catechol 2,3-dioxygenase-like lactoylglutathione lyase family enzyme